MKKIAMFLLVLPAVVFAQARGSKATIVDPGQVYLSYEFKKADSVAICKALGLETYKKIKANHAGQNWPAAIGTFDGFVENTEGIKNYTAFFECKFADGAKYILRIPVKENSAVPAELVPTKTLYFVINSGAVEFETKATTGKTQPVTKTKTPKTKYNVTVFDYSNLVLITTFKQQYKDAIIAAVGTTRYNEIAKYGNIDTWPAIFQKKTVKEATANHMKSYVVDYVCKLDDQYVLLHVPLAKNKHMTGDLALTHDLYFTMDKAGVSIVSEEATTDLGSGGKAEVYSAKVGDFNNVISTPHFTSAEDSILKKSVSAKEYENLINFSTEYYWPEGIATLDARNSNRNNMYDYLLEYVCSIGWADILRAPQTKNTHMTGKYALTHDIYFVVNGSVTKGDLVKTAPIRSGIKD